MGKFVAEIGEDNLRLLFPDTIGKRTAVYMCSPQGPYISVRYAGYDEGLEIYAEREILFGDLVADGDIEVYTDEVYYEDPEGGEDKWEAEEIFVLRLTAEGLKALKKRCEDLDRKVLPVLDAMIEAYKKM